MKNKIHIQETSYKHETNFKNHTKAPKNPEKTKKYVDLCGEKSHFEHRYHRKNNSINYAEVAKLHG